MTAPRYEAVRRALAREVRSRLVGSQRVLEQVSDRPRNEVADRYLAGIPRVRRVEHREEMAVGQDDPALVDHHVVVDEPDLVIAKRQPVEVALRHPDVMIPAKVYYVAAQGLNGLAELAVGPEDPFVGGDNVRDRRWPLVGRIRPEVEEIAQDDELRDGIVDARRVCNDIFEEQREISLMD